MKRLACFCLTCGAFFLFANHAACQDGGDMLKLLREKALERESAFDNVEATLSYTSAGWKERETPRPLKARWIRSGERRRMESETHHDPVLPSDERYFETVVETPKWYKALYEDTGDSAGLRLCGYIEKRKNTEPKIRDTPFSPELFCVTALPILGGEGESGLGTLARFLDPETPPRNNDWPYTRDLRFVGNETSDGRDLLVVEEKLARPLDPRSDPQGKGPKWEHTVRLYFDPSMNYACVMMDTWRTYGDYLFSKSNVVLSDFRELKAGLFVPSSCVEKWQENAWRNYPGHNWTNTYKIESLDFRAGFDDSVFDLEFPAGTRVQDQILRTNYVVGRHLDPEQLADFLPAPDDNTDADAQTGVQPGTAAEAPTSTPAQAPPAKPASPRVRPLAWLITAVLVLAAAAVSLRILRRNRRNTGR